MPEDKLTLDKVMKELKTIEHNRAKGEAERLHDSVILIHQYLGAQPDREGAYRTLKEEIQKDDRLDYVFSQI